MAAVDLHTERGNPGNAPKPEAPLDAPIPDHLSTSLSLSFDLALGSTEPSVGSGDPEKDRGETVEGSKTSATETLQQPLSPATDVLQEPALLSRLLLQDDEPPHYLQETEDKVSDSSVPSIQAMLAAHATQATQQRESDNIIYQPTHEKTITYNLSTQPRPTDNRKILHEHHPMRHQTTINPRDLTLTAPSQFLGTIPEGEGTYAADHDANSSSPSRQQQMKNAPPSPTEKQEAQENGSPEDGDGGGGSNDDDSDDEEPERSDNNRGSEGNHLKQEEVGPRGMKWNTARCPNAYS